MLLASLLLVVTSSATAAEDSQRIEGLITAAVHRNDFVLSSDGRQIVVDVSSLGGVTAAIAQVSALRSSGRCRLAARHFMRFV